VNDVIDAVAAIWFNGSVSRFCQLPLSAMLDRLAERNNVMERSTYQLLHHPEECPNSKSINARRRLGLTSGNIVSHWLLSSDATLDPKTFLTCDCVGVQDRPLPSRACQISETK
jgi:hypothetical protein